MLCVDEMGPIAVKTHPGEEWIQGPYRATFEPDYGRRGKVWVHGAFEPATGEAMILASPRRDSASHIQLLEQIIGQFPADRWLVIEDNLSTHVSRQVRLALAAWPEVQILFLPKYACWLNLIEPWWKVLRSLALKGRRFETWAEVCQAIEEATNYWNRHRHPFIWGRRRRHQPRRASGVAVLPKAA